MTKGVRAPIGHIHISRIGEYKVKTGYLSNARMDDCVQTNKVVRETEHLIFVLFHPWEYLTSPTGVRKRYIGVIIYCCGLYTPPPMPI